MWFCVQLAHTLMLKYITVAHLAWQNGVCHRRTALTIVFKIKSSLLQAWCMKNESNLARSLAWNKLFKVIPVALSKHLRTDDLIMSANYTFCFTLVVHSGFIASPSFSNHAAKLWITYVVLWKHVPCGTVKKPAIKQRKRCMEMMLSEDNITFIGMGTRLD